MFWKPGVGCLTILSSVLVRCKLPGSVPASLLLVELDKVRLLSCTGGEKRKQKYERNNKLWKIQRGRFVYRGHYGDVIVRHVLLHPKYPAELPIMWKKGKKRWIPDVTTFFSCFIKVTQFFVQLGWVSYGFFWPEWKCCANTNTKFHIFIDSKEKSGWLIKCINLSFQF